jgi:hypothetical protein
MMYAEVRWRGEVESGKLKIEIGTPPAEMPEVRRKAKR